MVTDDLSDATYDAIIIEAERFNHTLTLHFGLLCDRCDDEAGFIKESKSMIREFKQYNEAEIDDCFFGEPPPRHDFHKALARISSNINSLKKIAP